MYLDAHEEPNVPSDTYGFYCDLEQESPYIYEVIECNNCYKVVRKNKYVEDYHAIYNPKYIYVAPSKDNESTAKMYMTAGFMMLLLWVVVI